MKFKDKQIEDFDVETDSEGRNQCKETVINLYVKPDEDGYDVCVQLRRRELEVMLGELVAYEGKSA